MLKNKKVISMVSALCAFAFVGGVAAVNADAETATLEGFTCAGASVNAEEVGVRFVFNLEGEATAKQNAEAGVVYMPYDLYTGNTADFTIETATAATVGFGWEANEETEAEGDLVGYSYLAAESIPANMYNRVLLVRGYIADGENVYYTAPVKASMAYSAWKTIEVLPEYEETLKAYMGPYTLTSDAGNVENLYYGDVVTGLPTAKGGKNIAKWFWDAEKTNEIQATDYATGSMNIYYELEKFAVSGVVSGASNLETVKIYANGAEVGAVAANGEYTIWLEAGNYELTFANDGYVAYANVEVAAAVSQDVALYTNDWIPGQYGSNANVKTVNTTYNKTDVLDGNFTATASGNSAVVFPNLATTNAFEFEVDFSNVGRVNDESSYGILITTGWWVLSVTLQRWEPIVINMCEGAGVAFVEYWNAADFNYTGGKIKFVRTANKIELYNRDVLYCTFTAGAFTPATGFAKMNWDEGNANFRNTWASSSAGFFAEDAELTVGIMGFNMTGYTANCSFNEFATVSGKVSAPEGATVDFANTTLKVGGVACDMTIDAEGNFTTYVPAGTSTFEFKNGTWGATVADVVVSLDGANTVNATLADYKWAPGTFGSRVSNMTYDAADALDGNFAVSNAANKGILFPNLATTGNFTYTATFSSVARGDDDGAYGIMLSDGHWTVQVALKRWEPVLTNFCEGYGYAFNDQWNPTPDSGYTGGTLKFVRTAEKIEFYYNANLYFTFTATTFTENGFDLLWDGSRDCASKWAQIGANFFNSEKPITVGLVTLGNCNSFNVSCTFTNN